MILQALYEYYRKHRQDLPKPGLGQQEIKYMIVLENDGTFAYLENLCQDGKNKTGKVFDLPAAKARSGKDAWKTPQLLWDHYGFVLACEGKMDDETKKENAVRQKEQFVKQLNELPGELKQDVGVNAVLEFYRRGEDRKVFDAPEWEQCRKIPNCNLTFRLKSEQTPIACRPAVTDYVVEQAEAAGRTGDRNGCCLITGKHGPIVRLVTATAIPKSQATARLISFQTGSGYDSYGKEQCYNAPISVEAEFAFTTALNSMLAKESKNHFYLGDITSVFWVERSLSGFSLEEFLPMLASRNEQNREQGVQAMRSLCEAVHSGKMPAEDRETVFYFLGLSPNKSRLCVRFWKRGTVGELAENIAQHFEDLKIVKGPDYPSLYAILTAVVYENKMDNVPPNLPDKILRAALDGKLYPVTWLHLCLNRIGATSKITGTQAAVLKACINRKTRLSNSPYSTEKEIQMNYDPDNPNPAYQCGALFALFVKTQEEANPSVKRTVGDTFFTAASTRPASVFGRLVSLNRVHLKKIKQSKYGRYVNLDKMIQDIMCRIGTKFPGRLSPDDRARFCLGFYQYRQKLFEPQSAGADADTTQDTNQNNIGE